MSLDHPRGVVGGLYHCVKFGWNQCYSFDNIPILIFCVFWLKIAYSLPQNDRFWGFKPVKWGIVSLRPLKGISLCGHTSCDVLIVKISP